MFKQLMQRLLPKKIYLLLRARPKIAIISGYLYRKVEIINKDILWNDFENRGDLEGGIRKYAHILDKGLQSAKREPGHSKNISKQLKELLIKASEKSETKDWGQFIYQKYKELQDGKLTDYNNFCFLENNKIPFDIFASHLRERRSIRHFESKEVERGVLLDLLELARWAPSSCNRQTVRLYVSNSCNTAKACAQQNKGATNITGNFAFISVCYDSRSYHYPHEAFTGIIDATLAFANVISAVHCFGLGGCVLNWSNSSKEEESELRRILKIKPSDCICFNFLVGYPKFGAPVPGKKSLNEMIEWAI